MNIIVNGHPAEIDSGLTLQLWLEDQKSDKPWTVIEYNGEVLQREQWPSIMLSEGDKLEILMLLGGG